MKTDKELVKTLEKAKAELVQLLAEIYRRDAAKRHEFQKESR